MSITPTTLTRAAAVAAVAAGVIFIGVQINHPHLDATSIATTEVGRPQLAQGADGRSGPDRGRVLARWAAALLAVSGVVSVALTVMPDAFYRLLAYPNAVAMIGLGYSLWRTARASTADAGSLRVEVASGQS